MSGMDGTGDWDKLSQASFSFWVWLERGLAGMLETKFLGGYRRGLKGGSFGSGFNFRVLLGASSRRGK